MEKRTVDVLVLSDVHLGTRGCEAIALLQYLQTVKPKILVLNGDIVDIWQFRKTYFPPSHLAVLQEFIKIAATGTPVYYITGNHDDSLRKIAPLQMGNIYLKNKLVLDLDGKLAWIFHGDIYDGSINHGRWAAKIGGRCYDFMIVLNRFLNRVCRPFGLGPFNFSKRLKSAVKSTVAKVSNFETKAIEVAIDKGYDYVLCGHVHRPKINVITTEKGSVTYLNSGDWLENLTALEYVDQEWKIFEYHKQSFTQEPIITDQKVSLESLMASIQDTTIHEVLK